MTFPEKLKSRWMVGARVCVGLDSDYLKIPETLSSDNLVENFNRDIIEQTADLALAYKPNIAFYTGRGTEGWHDLRKTISLIRHLAPEVPVILDSKRGDIGNTNVGYVKEAFEDFGADAVTVSPYFGMEAMKPFLDMKEKGIIVLCRTSNPGASEFQDVTLIASDPPNRSMALYEYVAERVANRWNYNGNCALVVGATAAEQLHMVRRIVGDDMWILMPGIGTQGGDLFEAVCAGINRKKTCIIPSSSSGLIFPKKGTPRSGLLELTNIVNAILEDIILT